MDPERLVIEDSVWARIWPQLPGKVHTAMTVLCFSNHRHIRSLIQHAPQAFSKKSVPMDDKYFVHHSLFPSWLNWKGLVFTGLMIRASPR